MNARYPKGNHPSGSRFARFVDRLNQLIRFPSTWMRRQANTRRGRRIASAPARMFGALGAALTFPFRAVGHGLRKSLRMLVSWWRNRKGRYLLRGIPTLLLASLCIYFITAIHGRPRPLLAQSYGRAAEEALQREDYDAARLYFERLIRLRGKQDRETLYKLALTSARLKDFERVKVLMENLAPPDQPVHAPSHLWQARSLLAGANRSPENIRRAEAQLTQALILEPQNAHVHALLGQIYMSSRRWDAAEEHFALAVRRFPEFSLMLAKTHALQAHESEARRFGTEAHSYFRERVTTDPNDHRARVQWAESAMFLEQHASAVEILKAGLVLADHPPFRIALTRVYIAWADSLERQPPVDSARQLQLLEAGLMANPDEMLIFDRMMRILKRDDEAAQAARKMLVASIARGKAPALAHLLLGTDAGERGDLKLALHHLQRAYEVNPSMSIVANNLAWYLANKPEPELERALQLTNVLLEKWPQVAAIRDTRGHILVKLERWQEALADLNAALPELADNKRLHGTLGLVYEKLGLLDLAAEHRKLAGSESDSSSPTNKILAQ